MKIFIQSAGFQRQFEYVWAGFKDDVLVRSPFQGSLANAESLISSNYESILLYKHAQRLIMAITALPSIGRKRTDCTGTKIRNAILLSGEYRHFSIFREMIASYFQDSDAFSHRIDLCIENDPDSPVGFSANLECLKKLWESFSIPKISTIETANNNCFYAPDTPENRKKIVGLLEKIDVGELEGPILLVRRHEEVNFFQRNSVHLGLSNLITEEITTAREDVAETKPEESLTSNSGTSEPDRMIQIMQENIIRPIEKEIENLPNDGFKKVLKRCIGAVKHFPGNNFNKKA